MSAYKEVKGFVKRIRVVGWVALIATLILIVQLNLIITNAWANMDMQTQLTIFGLTMMVVIAVGFTRRGPDGFIKGTKKRKRK